MAPRLGLPVQVYSAPPPRPLSGLLFCLCTYCPAETTEAATLALRPMHERVVCHELRIFHHRQSGPQIHRIGMQHTTPGCCAPQSGAHTRAMHAVRPTEHISCACLLLCAHKQTACHELRFFHHRQGGPKSTKLACSTPHRAAAHPKAVPIHVPCMI